SLWLDDRTGRAVTQSASMDVGIPARPADFRLRLRTPVLGRAACPVWHRCSDDGDNHGVHGAVGDHLPANAEAHLSPGIGASDRDWRRGCADEPLIEPR